MKNILYVILISMFLFVGCSKENNATDIIPQISEQNTISTGNSSNTVVEHIMNNALKDSYNLGDEVLIRDKLFIAQCNDIYLNTEEYMDKTIRWEGIYTEATNPETNEIYKLVIRYGPGCCGNDGTAGFEILYDGETPKLDDWVEAVGKIELIEENGNEFVVIRISELNVLDVRGQETVSN